jgi:aldose 1-epimerase
MPTVDTEITLVSGAQRAVVSPFGASLRRYFLVDNESETDIVWGYSGSGKKGGQGDVLIPFPGRIAYGRYEFEGRILQLECNDKEGPNAIHGFLRSVTWEINEEAPSRLSFETAIESDQYKTRGYPFSLIVRVSYSLDPFGLSCSFAIRNVGSSSAPVGAGFHPYFTVGTQTIDDAETKIPATEYLELGDTLAPTGNLISVEGTAWDYRRYRPVGGRRFNHCYINLQRDEAGICTAGLRNPRNGRTIEVEMDVAFTALVAYTGDAIVQAPRQAMAIEPMTCATDAFNHSEWGLKRLAPKEEMSGRYRIKPKFK